MSIVISEVSLKKEGKLLLERLRNFIKEFKDFFRTDFSEEFFETIKEMKEDLNIAESVAIHEQLKREGKPLGDTLFWYHDYEAYTKDKSKDKKTRLIERAPSGFFRPDLESIVRILELVNIDMEIYEDLYFDIKYFLKKYEFYQELNEVSRLE